MWTGVQEFLTLDLRFKNLCIVTSFFRRDQGVVHVEKNDRKFLYHMWVKCHEHLHPFVKLDKIFINHDFFVSRLQFGYFLIDCKHK